MQGGVAGAVSIHNQTTTPFTSGVSVPPNALGTSPICAFPLYGKNIQMLAPVKKLLLWFSTLEIAPGSAVAQAYGPGILVNFADAHTRAIEFDINAGWNWGNFSWAEQVPAFTDIVRLLVVPYQLHSSA